MRRIFRDDRHQADFEDKGYLVRRFLDAEEIARLRGLYFETAGAGHRTYEFASSLRYYISVFDTDKAHRRAASDGIRAPFEAPIREVMLDYRVLGCNFMVKKPEGGEIQA